MPKPLRMGLFIVVAATALACLDAPAQTTPVPSTPEPQIEPALLFGPIEAGADSQPDPNSGLIKLDLTVEDEQGTAVSGLGQSDLTLLDNGQPGKVVTFQALHGEGSDPDSRTEIILVINEIDTPADDLFKVEETAKKFLQQSGGHLPHPVMVYRISNGGLFSSAQPTRDGNALAREITEKKDKDLRTIWRSQDLSAQFERVYSSSNLFNSRSAFRPPYQSAAPLQGAYWSELPHALIALGSIAIEERRVPGRKLLFWVGNPWNVRPRRWLHLFDTVTELSTRLREARITLWFDALLLHGDFEDQNYRNLAYEVLAAQSGGGVITGGGDPADQISQRVAQANAFYTITFDPERDDNIDAYHELKIEVDKPGLTVQTRAGYYDEPAYYDQIPNNVEHVTVAQLHDAIAVLRGSSGSEAERQLKKMQLIERLSSADLDKLIPAVKGNNAKEALIALADQSAFLPPPAQDIPKQPPPAIAEQRQMVQSIIDYVNKTVPILPDLNADRTTTLYLEALRAPGQTWKTAVADQSLYPAVTTKEAIHVSDGKEITQGQSVKKTSMSAVLNAENRTLKTEGTFGPILGSILVGVSKPGSTLQWGHWERSDNTTLAVFRFQVPDHMQMFHTGFCCLALDGRQVMFEIDPASHGEITVDPVSGAIVRLTIMAGLPWRLPLERSDIMVEYSQVNLGGTNYYCPSRSVSISRQRSVVEVREFGETFKVYAPYESVLNDMTYENYHLFRSTSRILPGFTEAPDSK